MRYLIAFIFCFTTLFAMHPPQRSNEWTYMGRGRNNQVLYYGFEDEVTNTVWIKINQPEGGFPEIFYFEKYTFSAFKEGSFYIKGIQKIEAWRYDKSTGKSKPVQAGGRHLVSCDPEAIFAYQYMSRP